jgi:hypothetical protein
MFSQVLAAIGAATCLLRDRRDRQREDRLHRINYVAEPRMYNLDDARAVDELIRLGTTRAEAVPNRTVVMERFLNGTPAWRRPKA